METKVKKPDILVVAKHVYEKYKITELVPLHRVLYLLDQDYFNQTGEVLFKGDFEAWAFGSVSPKLFNYTEKHGKNFTKIDKLEDEEVIAFIKKDIKQYKKQPSYLLVQMTKQSQPYIDAYEDLPYPYLSSNKIIFK